jgi:uncharacterized membrane protein
MSTAQGLLTVAIVFAIGYGALYKADDRNPDREVEFGGVSLRYLSLVAVAYLSVSILALAFDAPGTFLADMAETDSGAYEFLGWCSARRCSARRRRRPASAPCSA